jgi:hypothetical protein
MSSGNVEKGLTFIVWLYWTTFSSAAAERAWAWVHAAEPLSYILEPDSIGECLGLPHIYGANSLLIFPSDFSSVIALGIILGPARPAQSSSWIGVTRAVRSVKISRFRVGEHDVGTNYLS